MENANFEQLCGYIDRALLDARLKVRGFLEQAENQLENELFRSLELTICDLIDANNKASRSTEWRPLIEGFKRAGLEFSNQEQAIEFIEGIARERSEEEQSSKNI